MLGKLSVFRASIHENRRFSNSCTEAVLITDELHDKIISFASEVYDPYSIQIDSKTSVNTQILDLAHVMFKPIIRTDKMYVECQYTNFIVCS